MPEAGLSIPAFATASASSINFRGSEVPVAELAAGSAHVAQALTALGIGRGDRLAVWLPNCPEWFTLFFAAARIGAIAVMVNTRYRSTEVADIVNRSGAKALFLWPGFRGIDFQAILADIPSEDLAALDVIVSMAPDQATTDREPAPLYKTAGTRSLSFADFLALGAGADEARMLTEEERANAGIAIFTTSGTTSKPKFVLHSQENTTRHATDVVRSFGMADGGAPLLQTLPLCGVFGFCQAMATIAAGRPMMLEESFSAPVAVASIRAHAMTHFFATDDMLHAMLDLDEDRQGLRSLEMVGFAAFNGDPGPLMDRCDAHGVPLVGLYGMSEVMALFAAQPVEADRAQRILGGGRLVCPETRVRVRDPETGTLLDRNQIGALEIKSPNQMLGYFQNDAATAETIDEDGYIRTGDAGYLDDVGFAFVARMGDALRLGGFLVAPEEIMAVIDQMESVSASQVVGVTIDGKSRCAAFVIPGKGQSVLPEDVIHCCAARLAPYKAPVAVWFVDSFPTTPSPNGTKVQRRKLQALAQSNLDGGAAKAS